MGKWIVVSAPVGRGVSEPVDLRSGLIFWHDLDDGNVFLIVNDHNAPGTWEYANDNSIDSTSTAIGTLANFAGTINTWGTYEYGFYFNNAPDFVNFLGANDFQYNVWVILADPPASDPSGSFGTDYETHRGFYEVAAIRTALSGPDRVDLLVKYLIATNEIEVTGFNAARASVTITAPITRNTPSLISVFYDSTAGELGVMVNGSNTVTGALSGGIDTTPGEFGAVPYLSIGSNDYDFFGTIGRDSFYDRVLNSTENAALYNSGNSIDYAGTAP